MILADINISISPAKKTPVLASASDITRQANNPINVRQQKNSPISAKNFIPNIIILKRLAVGFNLTVDELIKKLEDTIPDKVKIFED